MKNEIKYTTIFSSTLKPLVSEEKDQYLAMASLLEVGNFIPDIDVNSNYDLLPVAFNACVANRVNKNGDVICGGTAVEIYNSFINKPINLEHNRERVVGTILTAGFSEFGTDKPLSEDEVKDLKSPFNITLGGVIWRVVNNDLTDLIEEASDPTSEKYQMVSASWELGFSEFQIVALCEGEKNIENAEIFADHEKVEELKDTLTSFGGDGLLEDGRMIYRQVTGSVLPLGIGLTESPAADVVGVAVEKEEKERKENNISQNSEKNVNQIDNVDTYQEKTKEQSTMKIESLKDITEESVKTLTASAVSDFISEEVKEASEKFVQERDAAQTSLRETEEKHETLSTENELNKEQIEKLNSELTTLKSEIEQQKKEVLFNERMASFDEEYELSEKDREVIASDIKDLDEEAFTAYNTKMTILLEEKKKSVIAEKAETAAKEDVQAETEVKEEVKASEVEDAVEEAVEQAEVEEDTVANTTDASEASVYEKYKSAFDIDGFDINYNRKN